MRIALIAPPWLAIPPTGYGGTEVVIDTLARGLQAAGHSVLLAASGDSRCPVELVPTVASELGTDAVSPAAELASVVNAYEGVLEWLPDIIHDHTISGPIHGRGFNVPIVTTNHGPFSWPLSDCYRAISRSAQIIAISNHHASTAPLDEVAAVIHHGLEVDSVPVGAGGDHAVFLGRMSPDKGVHVAIAAARAAGIPLLIAAKLRERGEQQYFDEVVAPLLGGDVEYVGEISVADKAAFLGGALCLLNPIRWPEPFGMVMIESLACGTPVVATAHGAVPEIIDDGFTGFVCRSEDELPAALGRVGELSRDACRRAAATRFDAADMVERHVDLYRRTLRREAVRAELTRRSDGRSLMIDITAERTFAPDIRIGAGAGFHLSDS